MSERAEDLAQLVDQHPFLKDLDPRLKKILAECAMLSSFSEGEKIFRQGDPANRFYLLLEGSVELGSESATGTWTPIQTIGPGDVLGWSWLFPPYYWNFSAKAREPVKAIFFYGTRLREHCEVDCELGYELMKRMSEVMLARLQATRKRLVAVTSQHGD